MSDHLTDRQLELYRRRSLPPDELLLVNDHLFSCDSCFERFDPEPVSIRDINSLLLGPDDHPDEDTLYERMEGYVDHKLSPGERREFQGHIEKCEACREEVADLLLLREALLDDPAFVPNEQPPPAVPKSHAQPRRLFNTWGVALAAAAVLLFIASAVLIFHLKRETNVLDARVQSLTQENQALQQHPSAKMADATTRTEAQQPGHVMTFPMDATNPGGVVIKDGNSLISLENGQVSGLGPLSEDLARPVAAALQSSRVAVPSLADLHGKRGQLMGGGDNDQPTFSLKSPVATIVEDTRPQFSWARLDGALNYTVSIAGVGFSALITSPPIKNTSWRPLKPLLRGRTYYWQVRAALSNGHEISTPAPPLPDAKFKVLSEFEESKIQEARNLSPVSHLVLGVIYAQAGLVGRARAEFQELVHDNPGSRVAKSLLGSTDRPGRSRVRNYASE